MADTVYVEDNDTFNAAAVGALLARENLLNYVERGFQFTADYANNLLDVTAGNAKNPGNLAVLEDGDGNAKVVAPDDVADLSLTDGATNYVYVAYDPSNRNDVYYHVDTNQSPPSDPSLLVGEVDTATDSAALRNREPAASFESVETQSLGVGGARVPPHPITFHPLSLEANVGDSASTTNTSGSPQFTSLFYVPLPDGFTVGSMDYYIRFKAVLFSDTAGESATAELRTAQFWEANETLSGTQISGAGTTANRASSGWVKLSDELTGTDADRRYRVAYWSSDGAASATLETPVVQIAARPDP